MPARTKTTSLYSVHPGVAMVQNWIASLPAKTGRTLEQWLRLVQREAAADERQRATWLRAEHGFGTNEAAWLAARASGRRSEEDTPEGYLRQAVRHVDAMYAGGKAGLRPLHDALLELARSLGDDVKVCPCKTIVPLYRRHVFAQLEPATKTRVDLGLALRDTPAKGRLIDTGGFAKKDRITHRIPISTAADIDAEVRRWLRMAYDMDA